MVQRIGVNDIALTHECCNRTNVGHIPRGVQQREVDLLEASECVFEGLVNGVVARDEARAGGTGALGLQHCPGGLGDARIGGQSEIIVRGEVADAFPVVDHGPRAALL